MADFEVNVHLDPVRFEAAIDDIAVAARRGADNGARAAADYIKEELDILLAMFPHARSEPTETLKYKGPPGFITGHLRDYVRVTHPLQGTSKVGSYAEYARIQEFGGWAGTDHMTYIPPRPYFRPTVMSLSTWGEMEHIFSDEWRKAMMRAVLF